MTPLEQFKLHTQNASYDIAGGEGNDEIDKALEIFDAHPELESQFREIAKDQLWSLTVLRPEKQQ